jgi:hypothetical protein
MQAQRGHGAERRRPITAALVDEESLVRDALYKELSLAGVEVIGEADNGPDAVSSGRSASGRRGHRSQHPRNLRR